MRSKNSVFVGTTTPVAILGNLKLSLFLWTLCSCRLLFGQSDSIAPRPAVDSAQNISLKLQMFVADDPNALHDLDTLNSVLPKSPAFDRALPNGYTLKPINLIKYLHDRILTNGFSNLSSLTAFSDNYTFLSPNQAFTEVRTNRWRVLNNSQAGFQDNFDLNLLFAASFRGNTLWNFSYDRNIFKGIYAHEKERSTLFTTGVHHSSSDQKYFINVIYTDERHYKEHNWGIRHDSLLALEEYSIREALPVWTTSPLHESSNRSFSVNVGIRIKKDSTTPFSFFQFHAQYALQDFDYRDESADSLSAIYGRFLIDKVIHYRYEENFFKTALTTHLLNHPSGRLELGPLVELQTNRFPLQSSQNSFYGFKAKYRFEYYKIKFSGQYISGLQDSKIHSKLNAELFLNSLDHWNPILQINYQSLPFPYVLRNISLNDSIGLYTIDPGNTHQDITTKLIMGTKRNELPTFSVAYSKFKKLPFFTKEYFIKTLDAADQWSVQMDYKPEFKKFKYHLSVQYQHLKPDSTGITGLLVGNMLSYEGFWFQKTVYSKVGVLFHLLDFEHDLQFFPVMHWFYLSDKKGKFIYNGGVFMHFTVKDFMLNVDLNNIESFWQKQPQTLVTGYPIHDFTLRLSFAWRFLN